MRLEKRYKPALICFMLGMVPLLAMDIAWVSVTVEHLGMRLVVSGLIGAFAGAFLLIAATESLRSLVTGAEAGPSPAAPAPAHTSDTKLAQTPLPGTNSGIITFGQSGGSNTVYNGERLATIGPETVAKIKDHIPAGSTVTIIKMMNDAPSSQMEQQFKTILLDNGYKIGGSGIGLGGDYFKGYSIHSNPTGTYTITLGDPRL